MKKSNKYPMSLMLLDKKCWCGLPLFKIDNKELCQEHLDRQKKETIKRGRYSGKSNSEHAFGNY